MKPLELTVYPYVDRWEEVPVTTHWGTTTVHDRVMGYERPDGVYDFSLFGPDLFEKRLTDAELSAEMWRQAAWIGALGRSYAMPDRYIAFDAAFHEGPATEDEYQVDGPAPLRHPPPLRRGAAMSERRQCPCGCGLTVLKDLEGPDIFDTEGEWGRVSARQCHGCGRTDGLHASASYRGEERFFCHDDIRSCYNEWRGRYFEEPKPEGGPRWIHGVVCLLFGCNQRCPRRQP